MKLPILLLNEEQIKNYLSLTVTLITSPPLTFSPPSCRLPYAGYFGGVSGLSKKQFLKINGFPNEYWGWGGEDDDIYNR